MKNKDKIITLLFYIMLVITAVWDYFKRDGEKFGRIILICFTILGVWYICKKTFLKIYNYLYKAVLFFIFISMYLANVFNFYKFQYYDKFLHLLSGIMLAIVGLILYMYLSNNSLNNGMKKITVIIFPMIFAVACAGAWEIWEFATDQIFGFTAQWNDLHDTMWDIICGTVGGAVSSFFIWLYLKGVNIKIIKNIIKDK